MRVCASLPTLARPAPRTAGGLRHRPLRRPLARPRVLDEPSELLADERVAVAPVRRAPARTARRRSAPCPVDVGGRSAGRVAGPQRRGTRPSVPRGGKPLMVPPAPIPTRSNMSVVLRDRPAVVQAADEVGVGDHRVVEEHLVEQRVAGDLDQRADGHAGLVEREREPRDARVLRDVDSRCGRGACRSRPPSPSSSRPSGPRSPSGRRRASRGWRGRRGRSPTPGSLNSWHQATEPS